MNMDVIKRYKKEFEHWLEHGDSSVLFRSNQQSSWMTSDIITWGNRNQDICYIINDAYVELRKSIADGKTIQSRDIDGSWYDLDYVEFIYEPLRYRVKPETVTKWQWIYKDCDNKFGITNFKYQSIEECKNIALMRSDDYDIIEPYLPSEEEFEV